MTRNPLRPSLIAPIAAAVAAVAFVATPASAHVDVGAETAVAGEATLIEFTYNHGCAGSPTTAVRFQIPEGVNVVYPTVHPGYDIEIVRADAPEGTVDGHGNAVADRVSEVIYTAKEPVASGLRDVIVLQAVMPDTPGVTVYFPTIQSCVEGESAWIEIPADGQSADDLEKPAPGFLLVESDHAEAEGH